MSLLDLLPEALRRHRPGNAENGTHPERMRLHGGTPYWLVRNAVATTYTELDRDITTDVAIIGGGVTGALCAYHLMEAGVHCAVVDGRAIGLGSTCASTALLQYEIDTPLHELVDLVGRTDAVRAYEASVQAVQAIIELSAQLQLADTVRRPSVQYASKRSHVAALEKEARIRTENGISVDLLLGEETRSVLPFTAPAALRSALAAETDAWSLTTALLDKSQRMGAHIHERTPIVDVRENGSGVQLRTAKGHSVRARHLIHATGYESQQRLPAPVIDLHSTYALIAPAGTARAPWPDNALLWETARPYLYMRTVPEGRLMIGGRDEPFRSPAMRDALLLAKTAALVADAQALLPDLPLHDEHSWCGTFGSTKDGLPYIDRHPSERNTWFALGMGGNGITFSVTAAAILRDRITGRANAQADLFRFDR